MKKLDDLLGNFFDKSFYQEGEEYLQMKSHWNKIVGDDLADHIKLYDVRDNILEAHSDHPGWAQMFQMKKKGILKKVQHHYPQLNIKDIRVKYKDNVLKQQISVDKDYKPKTMDIEMEKAVDDKDFSNLLDKFRKRSESES